MAEDNADDDESSGGGVSSELVASYLAFAKRALLRRKFLALGIFVVGASLAIAAGVLWPRTYHCETRIIAQQNQVLGLRGDSVNDALRGASDLVLRRDNIEAIVKQADLVHVMATRRSPLRRIKDALLSKLRDPPNEKGEFEGFVWTLTDKLTVTVANTDATLTIGLDWPDAQSSAQILEITKNNFLEARHVAEISTIAEYASILEDHAATIRTEVDQIAEQVKKLRTEQREKLIASRRSALAGGGDAEAAPRRTISRPRAADAPDEELPRLKAMADAKQRAIAELEDDRNRRLLELQSKLTDYQTKYTEAHPAILDVKQSMAALSHESPQVASLRSELADIEGDIRRRTGGSSAGSGGGYGGGTSGEGVAAAGAAAPLPPDIMDLMQNTDDDLDPAVEAQLRYAVEKYTTLRSQISNARIDLDTAQAAFNHRYKTIVPPEVPLKPIKPKVPVIYAVGLLLTLLLAVLLPVVAELRAGTIVESWQVQQLALPVLAELRFPPRSTE